MAINFLRGFRRQLPVIKPQYKVLFKGRIVPNETTMRDPRSTGSNSRFFSTTVDLNANSSIRVLSYNESRQYLLIQNPTANSVHLDFDKVATQDSIEILPQGVYESISGAAPQSEIYMIGTSGTQRVTILESY